MAAQDWHDALGALQAKLGHDHSTEETPAPVVQDARQTERLDIIFEKKGRGGKTATIVSGFTISDNDVEELASEMKKKLGAGGSARGGEILIQGDRRDDVLKFLVAKVLKLVKSETHEQSRN